MSNKKRHIWVTFTKTGFHYYPEAATSSDLSDVSYLGSRHRHKFGFKVQIEVTHANRELEFHQVLNFCESLYNDGSLEVNHKSVEMIADDLYAKLIVKYPDRSMVISVDEDGECGCTIEYPQAVSLSPSFSILPNYVFGPAGTMPVVDTSNGMTTLEYKLKQ